MSTVDDRLGGFYSLFDDVNKSKSSDKKDTVQGVVSSYMDELSVSTPDEKLMKNAKQWEASWINGKKGLDSKQKILERYWMGKAATSTQEQADEKPTADNMIFESLETFLPRATSKNPDPSVSSDGTPEGQTLARSVEMMLKYLADNQNVNLLIRTRFILRPSRLFFFFFNRVSKLLTYLLRFFKKFVNF